MLIIFQNEADLLADKIKDNFNKHYKNLSLQITYDISNDLLRGMNIILHDNINKYSENKYVSVMEFGHVNRLIEYIVEIVILKLFDKLVDNTYRKATS